MLRRFVDGLQRYGSLSQEERRAVLALPATAHRFQSGEEIVAAAAPLTSCRVLCEGLAFRHRTLGQGRREILAFHTPGDICDLQGLLLTMDHGVSALGAAEVVLIPHAALRALMKAHPAIARALWRISLVEGAGFREWMVGMGRRSAYARIAHLFCEMVIRLRTAGLMSGDRCRFPISQIHLSDALGLSVVHTNRVLQALRADGLISLRGGELAVHDWAALQAAGEFDPAYLHLQEPTALARRA